jgi:hypothetical protein
VFGIHHPWFMDKKEIIMFMMEMDKLCKKCEYDGVIIYINKMLNREIKFNMNELVEEMLQVGITVKLYDLHFNYKMNMGQNYIKNENIVLDYEKYIDIFMDKIKKTDVNSLVFDFDNNARLINPNRQNKSTVCINNTDYNKQIYLHNVMETQEEEMMLVNAWNEWGEKMAIEPSNELKYYYLNLLNKFIK